MLYGVFNDKSLFWSPFGSWAKAAVYRLSRYHRTAFNVTINNVLITSERVEYISKRYPYFRS